MNASNNILFSVYSDTCKPPSPLFYPTTERDTFGCSFRISQNSSIFDNKKKSIINKSHKTVLNNVLCIIASMSLC